jgi:hypothetical protein
MPHAASWNGRWSGQDDGHFIFKSISDKYFKENENKLIGSWFYSWPDGWGAQINGRLITSDAKKKLQKINRGFCGYGWMVDSIMLAGEIYTSTELRNVLLEAKP